MTYFVMADKKPENAKDATFLKNVKIGYHMSSEELDEIISNRTENTKRTVPWKAILSDHKIYLIAIAYG